MSENLTHSTRVGVGVMIIKEGRVLLGKRKGSHGAGEFSFPGGHLEYMESYEACARRETYEEAGIEIENIRFLFAANIQKYSPKHYAHIGLIADWKSGEPQVMEPEKCDGWKWYDLNALPEGMFGPVALSLDAYRTGRNYYDTKDANALMA